MDRPQSFLHNASPELAALEHLLRVPGLSVRHTEVARLAHQVSKSAAVLLLKQKLPVYWLVFMGGTGTGKSTLFNAFCSAHLSAVGVERPKTYGPILFAHRQARVASVLAAEPGPAEATEPKTNAATSGIVGRLTVIEHDRNEWRHLIVVDTPDLDSVATENRSAAEDLYLLADAVIFVSSQEKYADEVPYRFLLRILEEQKPLCFILNKAQSRFDKTELLEPLRRHGRAPTPEQIWLIPFAPHDPEQWIAQQPVFQDLRENLLGGTSKEPDRGLHVPRIAERAASLRDRIDQLQKLLAQEQAAARAWLERLDQLYRAGSRNLLSEEEHHFASESRQVLQAEIRKLFSRYDVLAAPRKLVREVLFAPLRLFGIGAPNPVRDGRAALRKARDKADLTPVQNAVIAFNHSVLQELSPKDEDSPLFGEIRQPQLAMTENEVRDRVWREQECLVDWLEETFRTLAGGISKSKQWGIYSTSLVWGVLILAFETTIGGGFTVIDAALDSALAPFVTKGAVELFAYNEIQRVARELAKRYQDALLSVLTIQRDRYATRMRALLPAETALDELAKLRRSMKHLSG
jgi:GTPase SAR1 family protein